MQITVPMCPAKLRSMNADDSVRSRSSRAPAAAWQHQGVRIRSRGWAFPALAESETHVRAVPPSNVWLAPVDTGPARQGASLEQGQLGRRRRDRWVTNCPSDPLASLSFRVLGGRVGSMLLRPGVGPSLRVERCRLGHRSRNPSASVARRRGFSPSRWERWPGYSCAAYEAASVEVALDTAWE
jgi:hypothetical protein